MKTHNSAYRVLMTIGMFVLASLGLTAGIGAIDFLTSSPFELFSQENRSVLLKSSLIVLIGLGLMLIAGIGLVDTYFDHRGG